ncbi:MAG: Cof-type HAD-IIB family hydrolase [Brevinema sp.]
MLDPKSIKAIAVDCDGTLINSREELSSRTKAALKAVLETGRHVYMATGRSVEAAKAIALDAGINRYMVNYNGAVLWNFQTNSIDREILIDSQICLGVYNLLRDAKIDFLFYEKGQASYEFEGVFMEVYLNRLKQLGVRTEAVSFANSSFSNTQKIMVFAKDDVILNTVKSIQHLYGDKLNLLVSRPYAHNKVVDIECTFLEIVSLKTDKAVMLEELATIEGFTLDNIMTFGDEFNDIRMLQNTGWGVAMGNAPKEVQNVANDVTLWHDEDGIAVYLEKHLL